MSTIYQNQLQMARIKNGCALKKTDKTFRITKAYNVACCSFSDLS
jgi:hypothetical protein